MSEKENVSIDSHESSNSHTDHGDRMDRMDRTDHKDHIEKMIDRLKQLDSYVDLARLHEYNKEDDHSFDYPINNKDLESVHFAFNSIVSTDDSQQDKSILEVFQPIGIFKAYPSDQSTNSTHIAVKREDDRLLFQIDDLPTELAYEVRTLDELNSFLKVYYHGSIQDGEELDQITHFDLRRNKGFKPIMMERYMVLSRFTEPYIFGPYCNPLTIEEYLATANSFNISVQYFDIMKQNNSSFIVTVRSKYSGSLITIKFRQDGVTCEVEYTPVSHNLINTDSPMNKFISTINANCDFPIDLPLDVILFLAPMTPFRHARLLDQILTTSVISPEMVSIFNDICPSKETRNKSMVKLYDFCKTKADGIENDDKHNSNRFKLLMVTIKNNITDRYLTEYKEEMKLEKSDDIDKETKKAINTIRQNMTQDEMGEYINESYIRLVITRLIQLYMYDNESGSDNESA
jgi:hypothetical protein